MTDPYFGFSQSFVATVGPYRFWKRFSSKSSSSSWSPFILPLKNTLYLKQKLNHYHDYQGAVILKIVWRALIESHPATQVRQKLTGRRSWSTSNDHLGDNDQMILKVRVVNYNDPGYLNPVMNNTVTDYQVQWNHLQLSNLLASIMWEKSIFVKQNFTFKNVWTSWLTIRYSTICQINRLSAVNEDIFLWSPDYKKKILLQKCVNTGHWQGWGSQSLT